MVGGAGGLLAPVFGGLASGWCGCGFIAYNRNGANAHPQPRSQPLLVLLLIHQAVFVACVNRRSGINTAFLIRQGQHSMVACGHPVEQFVVIFCAGAVDIFHPQQYRCGGVARFFGGTLPAAPALLRQCGRLFGQKFLHGKQAPLHHFLCQGIVLPNFAGFTHRIGGHPCAHGTEQQQQYRRNQQRFAFHGRASPVDADWARVVVFSGSVLCTKCRRY